MAKEIILKTFVYPGCIIICNGSAKYVNGYLPEIFHDRHIEWQRKRITDQMREFVEKMANAPFISQYYHGPNFYNE